VLIKRYATVGVVSNSDHSLQSMGKAGRNVGGVSVRGPWWHEPCGSPDGCGEVSVR